MNIKEAKNYIKDTVKLYLKKDEDGEYYVPVVRQRPIFLLGAPGIGKTAIMEQVASELGIAMLSYSMTHHTRQSALGLPYIAHKEYEGMQYDVSEYTMSEIIAAIYDLMKETGIREGILFLDEINCVSETLAPSMLQFLQYKVFGKHQVPEGWVIVTAGNPPEYNKSVRDFDVVTLDRMKLLEVEPSYSVWKEYASDRQLHTAILNYLELNRDDFYGIETTVKGRNYITARGWEDLSQILLLYEAEGMEVSQTLIGQYIHQERVVKEFSAYYDLYKKYQNDYKVDAILNGSISENVKEKAEKAAFDERISLMGLLMGRILHETKEIMQKSDALENMMPPLKSLKVKAEEGQSGEEIRSLLDNQKTARKENVERRKKAGSLSATDAQVEKTVLKFMEQMLKKIGIAKEDGKEVFLQCKDVFDKEVSLLKEGVEKIQKRYTHLFAFVDEVFGDGNELLILMTNLTTNDYSARFIGRYGCEAYGKHRDAVQMTDRSAAIRERIEALEI